MPIDNASSTYGPNVGVDAYTLCGKRNHWITVGGRIVNPDDYTRMKPVDPWLEFAYLPNGDPATESDIAKYEGLYVGSKCTNGGLRSTVSTCLCSDLEVV